MTVRARLVRSRRAAALIAVLTTALLVFPAPAGADPFTPTDIAYLQALDRGHLCCPSRPAAPIKYAEPDRMVRIGHYMAELMTRSPHYTTFHNVRSNNQRDFLVDAVDAGRLIVFGMRFYAEPWVERAVRAEMGDEASYWYGRA